MAMFGTLDWANAFMEAINSSKAYEDAAQTWEGDFYFIIEPGGAVKEPGYQYVDLWHGKCRKVDVVSHQPKKTNTSRNSFYPQTSPPGVRWQRKSWTPSRQS